MTNRICCPNIITESLLHQPRSFMDKFFPFISFDKHLFRAVETIMKKRTKKDFCMKWNNQKEGLAFASFSCALQRETGSATFYFFPEDELFVVAQAYGVWLPELYESLRDTFFRKDRSYKASTNDLYIGVPNSLSELTVGKLLHHFKLLQKIRMIRENGQQ